MASDRADSRITRRKVQTRDRILREAAKLFDEKGFAGTSVDEIVARADVSKGAFFNYFAKKDDLLLSVVDRRHRLAESAAAEVLSLAIPVRDQLLTLFAEAAHAWEEDREWSRHVLAGLSSGALRAEIGGAEAWRGLIRHCIERGQKSGEFRPDIDAARAEALCAAIYHDTLTRWGARPEVDLQTELREQLLLALDGLAE